MMALMSKDLSPKNSKVKAKGRKAPPKRTSNLVVPLYEEENLSMRERILKAQVI
jgi:hypothetical protein